MEARELRIGNYITAKGALNPNENYLTVCSLNDNGITTKYFSDIGKHWQKVFNKDNYKPIPLTEEWFIKLGFESINKGYYFYDFNEIYIYATIYKNTIEVGIAFEQEDGDLSQYLNIDYVHQLQNLYFALTGEELTTTQQ